MAPKHFASRDSEFAQQIPSAAESIVDFGNPPVAEVVCGIGFTKPSSLSSAHMGRFWSLIEKQFPLVETKYPLPSPSGETFTFELGDSPPLPRYFFRSKDRSELIQLQEDRFVYNWVKSATKPTYPRYAKVVKKFHLLRRKYDQFLKDNGLGPLTIREQRLTYVNHIHAGEGWKNPADISRVLPDFKFNRRGLRYLRPPRGWNFTINFPVKDDDSRLEVSIRTGNQKIESGEKQRIIILQLNVVGTVAEPSSKEIQQWFDMAREAIDLGFLDMTSKKMQTEVWRVHEH